MTANMENQKTTPEDQAELLLKQLMQLKRYETPETARMTRNKQNIMRMVRQANDNKRKSIGELLELSIPWFFTEPKYGIAALFVAFAALQYVGINAEHAALSQTGIYTSTGDLADYRNQDLGAATNSASYPSLPGNVPLFASPTGGDGSVGPASFEFRK